MVAAETFDYLHDRPAPSRYIAPHRGVDNKRQYGWRNTMRPAAQEI